MNVRSFEAHGRALKSVGVFCTQASEQAMPVLEQIEAAGGKLAVASLLVQEAELKLGHADAPTTAFIARLNAFCNGKGQLRGVS